MGKRNIEIWRIAASLFSIVGNVPKTVWKKFKKNDFIIEFVH